MSVIRLFLIQRPAKGNGGQKQSFRCLMKHWEHQCFWSTGRRSTAYEEKTKRIPCRSYCFIPIAFRGTDAHWSSPPLAAPLSKLCSGMGTHWDPGTCMKNGVAQHSLAAERFSCGCYWGSMTATALKQSLSISTVWKLRFTPAQSRWRRFWAAAFLEEVVMGNQTIKCCRASKLLSQDWGNHVECQKKKPLCWGEGIGAQAAAGGCSVSCKSALRAHAVTQLEKHVPSLHAEAKVGRRCWATGVLYKHAQDVILTMCWLGYYACKQTSVSKQRGSAGPRLSHGQQPCELWAMPVLMVCSACWCSGAAQLPWDTACIAVMGGQAYGLTSSSRWDLCMCELCQIARVRSVPRGKKDNYFSVGRLTTQCVLWARSSTAEEYQ